VSEDPNDSSLVVTACYNNSTEYYPLSMGGGLWAMCDIDYSKCWQIGKDGTVSLVAGSPQSTTNMTFAVTATANAASALGKKQSKKLKKADNNKKNGKSKKNKTKERKNKKGRALATDSEDGSTVAFPYWNEGFSLCYPGSKSFCLSFVPSSSSDDVPIQLYNTAAQSSANLQFTWFMGYGFAETGNVEPDSQKKCLRNCIGEAKQQPTKCLKACNSANAKKKNRCKKACLEQKRNRCKANCAAKNDSKEQQKNSNASGNRKRSEEKETKRKKKTKKNHPKKRNRAKNEQKRQNLRGRRGGNLANAPCQSRSCIYIIEKLERE